MSDILKKLGDKAKDVASTLKSIPPGDSEAQGIAEAQKQVDALSAQQTPAAPAKEKTLAPATEQDKVNPLARYGSRSGEKRLDTSYTDQPSAIKTYDNGGEVKVDKAPPVEKKTGMKPIVRESMTVDTGKPSSSLPALVPETKPNPTAYVAKEAPVYDDGGEVDVNDGKHEAAILQDGERVLTPEENEQYKREHPEKGAPADFSGPVFPNPKGIKPHSDTEPVTPKTYPGGAHMNIDNATIDEGAGDKEHFPTAMPTEASAKDTLSLKPYGQVMEEKAKQKAAEQVSSPGAQTSTSDVAGQVAEQPEKEEKPKLTYGHVLAEDWLKHNGLNVDAMKAPKEFNQGSQEVPNAEEGMSAPKALGQATPATAQGPMKPIVQPEAPTAGPEPTGKAAFQAKMQMYKDLHQSLMDKAAATNDPQYREQAARVQEAQLAYENAHPWGSKESAHPGVLGKIGHVAEMIGARTPGLAPIVASLPGSELNRVAAAQGAQEQVKEASAQNAEENKATTVKAATQPSTAGQIADYQERIKAIPGLSPEAAKVYGNVPLGTTAAELDKRFTEANQLTNMSNEQQKTMTAEQDRKDRAQQAQENHEQGRQDKLSKTFYTYTTTDPKTGKKTTEVTTGDKLDDLPEDAQLLPVKDMSSLMGEARSMNAVQDSMNEIHKDLHDHPEVFDNAAARSIIQTTTEQMNRVAATMLVAGTGGAIPLPSGLGDMINTSLQNSAMDEKTAKAVKNYIADYKSMKDKAMVIQMAMQNGKMGRGGQQAFESIVNQLPGGSTPDGATAIRQMSSLQRTLTGLNDKYPSKYADYTKTEPYAQEEAAPEGTAAAEVKGKATPKGEAKPAAKTNGYSANNPFAPKQPQ
jgi:hypothetical protein